MKNVFCTKDKKKDEEKSSTDDGFQRFSWKALGSKKALCAMQGRFKEVAAEKIRGNKLPFTTNEI